MNKMSQYMRGYRRQEIQQNWNIYLW